MLDERLLYETFQNDTGVSEAMAMTGIKTDWNQIADEMGEDNNDIKDRLNQIARRRNAIVHEGDLRLQVRPRAVHRSPILTTQ